MQSMIYISAEGLPADLIARALFACRPVCKSHLSARFSELPKGTVISMPTIGTPVNVSFPMPAAGSPNLYFLFTVVATQTNADGTTTVIPATGLTATSDNPNIVPTLNTADNTSFYIDVNLGTPLTGNVTITDGAGDTLVVAISQTEVPFVTLSGTAAPTAPQPHP